MELVDGTTIELGARSAGGDGYRSDFPLRHELAAPIVIDAGRLAGRCHPMFLLRLVVGARSVDVLHQQAPALAAWGDPAYMVVSELCGNAIQHGRNDVLPAYVAADRVDGDHRLFRLAIADIGIGIPEHIRGRHPEWHDDTGALTKALERGSRGPRTRTAATASPRCSTRRSTVSSSPLGQP